MTAFAEPKSTGAVSMALRWVLTSSRVQLISFETRRIGAKCSFQVFKLNAPQRLQLKPFIHQISGRIHNLSKLFNAFKIGLLKQILKIREHLRVVLNRDVKLARG
ncbi:hypothetical protein OGATHE_001862 [Ogataea polymorpha]|uniref:Uncharacterized protein n=1 Tax=Ogataea polymorpha TaxID=460523 RepID=A0A9P8PL68_9ASCO|nr:hypothetical protein OGATHE_001862 [Ogataea polymorpha]